MLISPCFIDREVQLPSSKSYLHRAIILASLCDKTTTLTNVWLCDDIDCTIAAMRQFAEINYTDHTLTITGKKPVDVTAEVDCKLSGSTLRFLVPLFAQVFDKTIFHCDDGLISRPIDAYQDIFPSLYIDKSAGSISVSATDIPPDVEVSGGVSSQYITGLLLGFIGSNIDHKITISPPFESRPYVDITLDMLQKFGVDAQFVGEYEICIKAGAIVPPTEVSIEPDFSQLAFFAVAGVLCGSVRVLNPPSDSLQGDRAIIEIIKQCGGQVSHDFVFTKSLLHATEVDVSNCPDLFPILAVLLTHAVGSSKISGISRLRYKESDRVNSMITELSKMGHDIAVVGDSVILSDKLHESTTFTLSSHGDHRVAMALAVAARAAQNSFFIEDFPCISKSFPEFFI